ncbi:MAG: flavin reductase family protein [Methanomassiliicoccales archaeon]|nr:flavin reductase family protein [Methanomassiliicoccales archaeon]
MTKIPLGRKMPTMGLPVVLVGAKVKGRPNFCTVAWATMIDDEPLKMAVVMGKDRKTKDGIKENGTFSINLPGANAVVATDYCGINSGYKVDKSEVFDVFFGKTLTAPMARECRVNIELTLDDIVEFEGTDMVVGDVEEVYVDEECLSDGRPDPEKLEIIMYQSPGGPYFIRGRTVAEAFKVGKGYRTS